MALQEWKRNPVVVPLKQAFPELGTVREFRSRQCIFSHDRKHLYAVAGKNYQPVPHSLLIDSVEQALMSIDVGPHKRNVLTTNDGARMLASYTFDNFVTEPQKGDVVRFGLRMYNSYDQSWKLDIRLSGYQLVCTNGMVAPKSLGGISSKHFKGVIGEDLALIPSTVQSLLSAMDGLGSKWEAWSDATVTKDEVEYALGLKRNSWLPKKHAEYILAGKFPMSRWDLYSRFTYAATHITKTLNRRVELDEYVASIFYSGHDEQENLA